MSSAPHVYIGLGVGTLVFVLSRTGAEQGSTTGVRTILVQSGGVAPVIGIKTPTKESTNTGKIREVVVTTAIVATLFTVVASISVTMQSATCYSMANAMHLPYTWGPMQECIVEYKGEFVPINAVGVRSIEFREVK